MGWRVGGTWIYTATALCFPSFCPVETESPEEAGASQVGPVKGRVCLFSLHLPAVPDAACCRWRTRRDPPWERMFQTPWRADRAEKGTLPLLAISHPHQDPDPPLPLSFMALDWSLRFLARCRLCTATTPSATGRQTASRCGVAWKRGETRKNARPGRAPHYPIPRRSTRYSNAYPGALHHQVMILPPAHGPRACGDPKGRGKFAGLLK
ncbi:uncharacterized protein LOC124962748 isoform X1 [Sciurus carolinensis]|uniref:uncharacterized protein LOC124962748 isoform X1 n=1 Tax=Sciurus carolinensis TaxID=30640 RepID=UPI001FB4CEBE|nr:uncharacterized protein LOC124962748 isoform X1 [Sciurus carolinensis]